MQSLRLWRRRYNRALELQLQVPDPLILVRALDGIVQKVISCDLQAMFRINSFRMQHQIDVRPTQVSVGHLYDLLLSEADQLLYGNRDEPKENPSVPSSPSPGIKALQPLPSPHKASIQKPCRFWGSESGCRLGSQCRFMHEWTGIHDRSSRCWTCSSLQHARSECPAKQGGTKPGGSAPSTPDVTNANASSSGATSAKSEGEGKTKYNPRGKPRHKQKQQPWSPDMGEKKTEAATPSPGQERDNRRRKAPAWGNCWS